MFRRTTSAAALTGLLALAVAAATTSQATAAPASSGEVVSASAASAVSAPVGSGSFTGAEGTYQAVTPARILDTRGLAGNPIGKVASGGTITVAVAGKGGVPATGASAVVLNVTATQTTANGYLTAFASGTARPLASSINFPPAWTGANLVTVPIGTNGKVSIFNSSGTTHVIGDVLGYYVNATVTQPNHKGELQTTQPERILDTRAPAGGGALPSDFFITLTVDYGAHNSAIRAFAVNITAVNPAKAGYLTAWNGRPASLPGTSSLNFVAGTTVPNMAVVQSCPLNTTDCAARPQIGVYNGSSGPVHVLVDLVGFYDNGVAGDGLRFRPMAPTRIIDTRAGSPVGTLQAASTVAVTAPARVAGANTFALVTNATAILPTASTYLTMYPRFVGEPRPGVSNVNAIRGQIVSNATITGLGDNNVFNIYNSAGRTNLAVDVTGSLEPLVVAPIGQRAVGGGPSVGRHQPLTPSGPATVGTPGPLR